jgi:hypothetical protein
MPDALRGGQRDAYAQRQRQAWGEKLYSRLKMPTRGIIDDIGNSGGSGSHGGILSNQQPIDRHAVDNNV